MKIDKAKRVQEGPYASGVTVSWQVLTMGLAVVSFAALAVLIIITTSGSADVLTTVALLLAILSFAAQLIVTASQAHSSNLHYRDLSSLSAHTQGTLTKLDERLNGMLESQRNTFEKLLNTVIDNGINPESLERALAPMVGGISRGAEAGGESGGTEGPDVAELAAKLTEELRGELKRSAEWEVKLANSKEGSSGGGMRRPRLGTIRTSEQQALEGLSRLLTADRIVVKNFIEQGHEMDSRGGRRLRAQYAELPGWVTELGGLRLVRVISGSNIESGDKFTTASLSKMGEVTLDALHNPGIFSDDPLGILVEKVRSHALLK